ncbi:hypothetical protein BJV78DRAFT_1355565 [Lactifluus subvellereus]|nr:hypothetical protein BJV78DRAFT_1355565 [Lactifluus subvellereus]
MCWFLGFLHAAILYFSQYSCMDSQSGQAVVIGTTATGADVYPKGQPCQRRSSRGGQFLDLTSQNLRAWTTNTARFLEEVKAEVKLYADPNYEIGRVCAAGGTWVDVDAEEANGGTRIICPWPGVRLLVVMNGTAKSLSNSKNTHRPSATG